MACGEEAQYAIAKSVNQIMLLKFHRGTKILCCICQTPLSSSEGGQDYLPHICTYLGKLHSLLQPVLKALCWAPWLTKQNNSSDFDTLESKNQLLTLTAQF